jgi:peptide/nickel transport system permease protein
MRNYIIRRVLLLIPTFLFIVVLVFFLNKAAPGGPLTGMMNPHATAADKARLAHAMGLDQPVYKQFLSWAGEVVKGNLGYSTKFGKPVVGVINDFIWNSFYLALFSLIISLLIGIPAGIISATKQYSATDNALTVFSLIGISMPSFFIGLLFIKFFAIDIKVGTHGLFPLFGMLSNDLRNANGFVKLGDILWHMVLPGMVLALGSTASFMRYTRSSMLEVIRQDYIRTARSKGLKERVVIYRHALRNAIIPIITLLGFWLPGLFSGAVITETIFGWPGIGKATIDAINSRDYGLLMAITMIDCFLLLVGMLLSDIFYSVADPRIKYE